MILVGPVPLGIGRDGVRSWYMRGAGNIGKTLLCTFVVKEGRGAGEVGTVFVAGCLSAWNERA